MPDYECKSFMYSFIVKNQETAHGIYLGSGYCTGPEATAAELHRMLTVRIGSKNTKYKLKLVQTIRIYNERTDCV